MDLSEALRDGFVFAISPFPISSNPVNPLFQLQPAHHHPSNHNANGPLTIQNQSLQLPSLQNLDGPQSMAANPQLSNAAMVAGPSINKFPQLLSSEAPQCEAPQCPPDMFHFSQISIALHVGLGTLLLWWIQRESKIKSKSLKFTKVLQLFQPVNGKGDASEKVSSKSSKTHKEEAEGDASNKDGKTISSPQNGEKKRRSRPRKNSEEPAEKKAKPKPAKKKSQSDGEEAEGNDSDASDESEEGAKGSEGRGHGRGRGGRGRGGGGKRKGSRTKSRGLDKLLSS